MNYQNNVSANKDEFVTFMSYDDFARIQDQMDQRRKARREKERQNRITYFMRQRVMGVAIMLVGIVLLLIGCRVNSETIQVFGAALGGAGLFIMVTKQMILIDSYYLECQDRINNG